MLASTFENISAFVSHGATGLSSRPQEQGVAQAPIGMPNWEVTSEEPLGLLETLRRSGQFFFDHLKALTPGQTAAIWIGLLFILVLAFPWRRPFSGRALALVLFFVPALLFFDLDAQSSRFGDVVAWSRFRYLTLALMGVQVLTVVWALVARFGKRHDEGERLPVVAIRGLALFALLLTLANCFVGAGADSSIYTNFGAQRMRERGQLPYGDPWLNKGTATAYGPAIYLMIIPAQLLLDREALNADVALPETYERSRGLPVRMTVAALIVVGFFGLLGLGRRLGDRRLAWTLVALVFSSPYMLGVGSAISSLVGAANISDTAPMVFLILAALWVGKRPILSGLSLAQATACGLFPILALPIFLVYMKRSGAPLLAFLISYAVLGLLYLGLILFATETAENETPVGNFLECVVGMQVNPPDVEAGRVGYGSSPFGFWGSHPEWRDAFLGAPGAEKKVYWGYLTLGLLVLVACLRARNADLRLFLALLAAVFLGFQLLRLHASGVHVMWYYPFLIAAFLARREIEEVVPADDRAPEGTALDLGS